MSPQISSFTQLKQILISCQPLPRLIEILSKPGTPLESQVNVLVILNALFRADNPLFSENDLLAVIDLAVSTLLKCSPDSPLAVPVLSLLATVPLSSTVAENMPTYPIEVANKLLELLEPELIVRQPATQPPTFVNPQVVHVRTSAAIVSLYPALDVAGKAKIQGAAANLTKLTMEQSTETQSALVLVTSLAMLSACRDLASAIARPMMEGSKHHQRALCDRKPEMRLAMCRLCVGLGTVALEPLQMLFTRTIIPQLVRLARLMLTDGSMAVRFRHDRSCDTSIIGLMFNLIIAAETCDNNALKTKILSTMFSCQAIECLCKAAQCDSLAPSDRVAALNSISRLVATDTTQRVVKQVDEAISPVLDALIRNQDHSLATAALYVARCATRHPIVLSNSTRIKGLALVTMDILQRPQCPSGVVCEGLAFLTNAVSVYSSLRPSILGDPTQFLKVVAIGLELHGNVTTFALSALRSVAAEAPEMRQPIMDMLPADFLTIDFLMQHSESGAAQIQLLHLMTNMCYTSEAESEAGDSSQRTECVALDSVRKLLHEFVAHLATNDISASDADIATELADCTFRALANAASSCPKPEDEAMLPHILTLVSRWPTVAKNALRLLRNMCCNRSSTDRDRLSAAFTESGWVHMLMDSGTVITGSGDNEVIELCGEVRAELAVERRSGWSESEGAAWG